MNAEIFDLIKISLGRSSPADDFALAISAREYIPIPYPVSFVPAYSFRILKKRSDMGAGHLANESDNLLTTGKKEHMIQHICI
jgi:hypothetical protein